MSDLSDSPLRRAELLADLGRFDEAAEELADAPSDDVAAHILLARIRLAAGRPLEALAAADAAVAADPHDIEALVVRGMALADLGRREEAAAQAEQILHHGRGMGYACTSAAAILAEVRNGQAALDAAWEGVRLTPDQPRAHLVLGVVAARLGLNALARRAYREALALDPRLARTTVVAGVVQKEHDRYLEALSRVLKGRVAPAPPRGTRPAPDARRTVGYAAAYALGACLMSAWAHTVGIGAGVVSVLLALAGLVGPVAAWSRLQSAARAGAGVDRRWGAVAVGALAAVPVLLVAGAVVGAAWPLAPALLAGLVAAVAAGRSTSR